MDYSAHIPYSSHLTESIVITAEGDLVATWELKGLTFETVNEPDLEIENQALHSLILSLSASGHDLTIYQHRTRSDFDLKYEQTFANEFADKLNLAYKKSLKKQTFKEQKLFFTVVFRPLNKTQKSTLSSEAKRAERPLFIGAFNEIITQVTTSLSPYKPKLLLLKEDEQGYVYSEPISFFNFLLSGKYQKVRVGNMPFYHLIGDKRYYFQKNTAEISDPITGSSVYAHCLEFKEYSDSTFQGMLDDLIYLNTNFIVTNSFRLIPRQDAQKKIKLQINRLTSADDDSVTQLEELDLALNDLVNGEISFGENHFSCMIFADNLKDLQLMTSEAKQALNNAGFITIHSDISLPNQFFAQLPANFGYRPRLSLISSWNYTNMIDMHSFALGRAENNAWGQSVTVLPTPSKQAFHVNFHDIASDNDFGDEVLGHTLITGQSGAGKTFFANFLLTQAQKFASTSTFPDSTPSKQVVKKFTHVLFDKDYGAMGAIHALKGKYIYIENGKPTGFNPFMLENTPDSRDFLSQLLRRLACQNTTVFTDRHADQLDTAIMSVMNMPKEERKYGISRVLEFLPAGVTQQEIDESLKSRLTQWKKGKKFGWVFDNEDDSFSLDDDIDNFGIDGTEFLQNKEVCGAITFYLLHRVMQLIDGRRLIITFDEFWLWLADPVFEDFVHDKLKTLRKLNAFLVCATQSPSDCLGSPIAAAIIEQCPTQIFLANPKAEKGEYMDTGANRRHFGLTSKEFDLLSKFTLHERKALIKNSRGSSVVALKLDGLGKYAKVLSTGINDATLINKLLKENPQNWLSEYIGENDHEK